MKSTAFPRDTRPQKSQAFTLVELIVVIAIIGVLASLLLPAFHRARQSALGIVCRNNLKQLGIAASNYDADTGRFPSLLDWLYDRKADVSDDESAGQPNLASGQLFPHIRSRPTYLCPTESPKSSVGMMPHGRNGILARDHSYVMNCRMCHVRNAAVCLTPSTTLLFMERTNLTQDTFGGLVAGGLRGSHNNRMGPALSFGHNQRGNVLMIDAHSENLNQKTYLENSTRREFWYPTAGGD